NSSAGRASRSSLGSRPRTDSWRARRRDDGAQAATTEQEAHMYRIVATLVFVSAVAGVGTAADPQTQPLRVEYRKDALSVHAGGVPLSTVLAEVSRVTGCRIVGLVEEARDVTADFDGVPVEDALRRLLGSQPFATRYHQDDLAMIELVDRGKGGEPVI